MELLTEKPESVVKLYDANTGSWKFVRKDRGSFKSLEVIEDMLMKLGLSKNEIKVYTYLARTGEHKASEISGALSLHRTETYRILRDLEKRGIVSSVFEKPLKFIATPFEKTIDILIEAKKLKLKMLEQEKKNLIDIWLSLPQPRIETERKEIFQILEGKEHIDLKANELLDTTEREILLFVPEDDLARFFHSGFIDRLEKASKKKIIVRLLTNYSPKSCFFIEKTRLKNVRYSHSDVEGLPTFIVSDEEQLLLLIGKRDDSSALDEKRKKKGKVASLWTNYEAFVKALRTLFLGLWNAEASLEKAEVPLKVVRKSKKI